MSYCWTGCSRSEAPELNAGTGGTELPFPPNMTRPCSCSMRSYRRKIVWALDGHEMIDLRLFRWEESVARGRRPPSCNTGSNTVAMLPLDPMGLGRLELPTSRLSDMSRALVGAGELWKQGDLADSALVGASQRWWAMIQVVLQLSHRRAAQRTRDSGDDEVGGCWMGLTLLPHVIVDRSKSTTVPWNKNKDKEIAVHRKLPRQGAASFLLGKL